MYSFSQNSVKELCFSIKQKEIKSSFVSPMQMGENFVSLSLSLDGLSVIIAISPSRGEFVKLMLSLPDVNKNLFFAVCMVYYTKKCRNVLKIKLCATKYNNFHILNNV